MKWLIQPKTHSGSLVESHHARSVCSDGDEEYQGSLSPFSSAFLGASTQHEIVVVQEHCWILPLIHSMTAHGPVPDNISRGTEEVTNSINTIWSGVKWDSNLGLRLYYKSTRVWYNIKNGVRWISQAAWTLHFVHGRQCFGDYNA